MPTVDEIVRSFSIHNVIAGCAWDGYIGRFNCQNGPDKETPLWGHLMNHPWIIGFQINLTLNMPILSAIQHLSAISPMIGVIPVTGVAV
jgi:hypothetical protein